MVNVNSEKRAQFRAWREFDDKTSSISDVCDLERLKMQSLTLSPYGDKFLKKLSHVTLSSRFG
jgi:hypothetical protein